MFIANSSKNEQGFYQATKDSICCNLASHRHNEDNFHHPQTLKLAYGTHTEYFVNRNKNTLKNTIKNKYIKNKDLIAN